MNRRQRHEKREKDEGNVFQPKRKPPMPGHKVIPLKNKKKHPPVDEWEL